MPAKKSAPAIESSPSETVVPAPAPVPPASLATPPAYQPDKKPDTVQGIAILTLVNGIINILWGCAVTVGLLPTIICWPIGAYPIVLGILEIVYAAKLLPNPAQPVQPATNIAVMEIVAILFGNPFALIGGILSLVFYSDPQVKAYFAKINSGFQTVS